MTEGSLGRAPDVALDKVEWRVDGRPIERDGKTRCRFVPYIDARDAADLLDEWVGPGNWSDRYEEGTLNGKPVLWCFLSVWVEGRGWVEKHDVGVPPEFEGQKGLVSDAFKRAACVKWGAGRNVYTLPTVWAPCRKDDKGKAWPIDQSLPAIHEQLKKMGYEAGGRVANVPEGAEPSSEPDVPERLAGLLARYEAIPADKQKALYDWVQNGGGPTDLRLLPEPWWDRVEALIAKAEQPPTPDETPAPSTESVPQPPATAEPPKPPPAPPAATQQADSGELGEYADAIGIHENNLSGHDRQLYRAWCRSQGLAFTQQGGVDVTKLTLDQAKAVDAHLTEMLTEKAPA